MAQAPSELDGALYRYYAPLWTIFPVCTLRIFRFSVSCSANILSWRKSDDNVWSCALKGRIISLRQDSTQLHYHAAYPPSSNALPTPPSSAPASSAEFLNDDDDTEALVHHYLNLEPNLTDLYEQWSTADLNFKKRAPKFAGVRILKQDAWEALVGFICSSNNNIIRISQMVYSRYRPMFSTITD